ncbi:MAG: molybdopterin molybdotransferase MoeA [Deltaproteobacteria bacterium]|nr:molybdopterin molybdotransferase MoeA [Deltaproteobacteria bacterium]
MISYGEAFEKIRGVALSKGEGGLGGRGNRRSPKMLGLGDAIGKIVTDDLYARESLPSFDNSAMDGYALQSSLSSGATPEAPLEFTVMGSVAAGDVLIEKPAAGNYAVEIMTGAPLPEGHCFDAVVRVEDVLLCEGSTHKMFIRHPVKPGANIRRKGEDFKEGQILIPSGRKLVPTDVLALASLGVSDVPVRRLKVAVISTGKELVPHTQVTLEPGMIRNSTGPYLMAALEQVGVEAKFYGTVHDEPDRFISLMTSLLEEGPDVIITTGAVSVGKYDFILKGLNDLQARIHFHKVAIRPGKPILFAEFEHGPVCFGLPGNPVSTAVGFRFFVLPYLQAMLGENLNAPWKARLTHDFQKPEGLRCFMKARWHPSPEGSELTIVPGQASFMVSSLLDANAWAILPEEGKQLRKGDVVELVLL